MSSNTMGYNINQTFIVEPLDDTSSFSACTALYANNIVSCSGNTNIFLSDGIISFNGAIYTNDDISANTIHASSFYSGGTNLIDIINDLNISGGSFNNASDTLILNRNNGSNIIVTGFTDYYTTGTTTIGNTVYFNRNDSLSAYTLTLPNDTFVTGVTFNNNNIIIARNDGVNLNTFINTFTGLTINGILNANTIYANVISATTYYGDGSNLTGISSQDTVITGGTYSNNTGTATFTNNTGGTFNVTGFYTGNTDIFVTGVTFDVSNYDLNLFRNDGVSLNTNLSILASDVTITGGTYNNNTGVATFTNNTGGTFNVSGFITGLTDTLVTGFTYNNNTLKIFNSNGQILSAFIDAFTGLTVGSLSATTYLGLPLDIRVTGGTYNNLTGVATFTNNTGGTFNVSGFNTGSGGSFTGGTITGPTNFLSGLTATTISATTYLNLPIDIRVTGGTYNNTTGTATFTNNTGGTFNISGFYTGNTDVFVTGGTYNNTNGTATFRNNTGGTFNISGFYTGNTDVFTTGGTYNNNTFTFTNNTGGTFNISLNSMTGLTVNGTLNADKIANLNYINFITTPTVPSPTGGTLYFDYSENALSYKPITNNNDVTVNLGQESLIKIYNNTGIQINNGQAIHITGSTSGTPTVCLAIASDSGNDKFQVSGIATHDIPNGQYGFATQFGIVRDLNLTAFSVGDQVYLSQTTGGGLSSFSGLSFSGRTCEIGHVIDNSLSGKLMVQIYNELQYSKLTLLEQNILNANVASSGVFQFTGLTRTSSSTFNIAPAKGWVVKTDENPLDPSIILVNYSGSTGNTTPYLTASTSTYVLLTSASTIMYTSSFPTPTERRNNILLGKVIHADKTNISVVNNTVDYTVSPMSAIRDLWTPIKLINQGVIVSANGANLNINTSAGSLWGNGINWATNTLSPNNVSISGSSPTTFQYRVQTGGTFSDTTSIDPDNYDVGGILTAIPGSSNRATNQRIYLFPTGLIRIQYGQQYYSTLADAVAAVQTETYIEYANNRDNGILIGILTVKKAATDLSSATDAYFTRVTKFGDIGAGAGTSVSTTTLQQAYNNSSTPELITTTALGGLSVKNGSGNPDNTSNVFEAVNSSSNLTAFVRADGLISGSSVSVSELTATTISATTYLNLPIDIRVTGGTYNNTTGSATFTNNTGGTFNVTGFYTGNTDVFTTGGTYNNTTGTATFRNNTGGTFNVTGFYTGNTDVFTTGGTYNNNTFTFTNNTGGTFNISLNSMTGLTVNGTLTVTGNTNVSGATNIVGDVTAFSLVSSQSVGDEGGEIRLAKAQTNTTLSGTSITIDIFQNKLRFFETASPNRGAYIDLTAATSGVGSNLLAGGSSSLTIGSTSITSGSAGRILFESTGNTLQESSNLYWDNTNIRLSVGQGSAATATLDVRASGTTSASLPFRVRNSTDTANIFASFASTQFIFGGSTSTPSGLILTRHDFGSATNVLTIQNGQYGNNLFRVRDERTASSGTIGSIYIGGRIYDENATTTRQLDLGGYGLGATWGDHANNTVVFNTTSNIGDGQGSIVMGKSSNFYVSQSTGGSPSKQLKVDSNGNVAIAQMTVGTSATNTVVLGTGTAPSTSPIDAFQMYSNDIVAGNAAAHFRTEGGAIIKLYQQTTAVASGTYNNNSGASVTINDTFDGYTIGQIARALRNNGLLQ